MILLAGVGVAVIISPIRSSPRQWCAILILIAGVAHLAGQAWATATTYAADQRNPYVYAQTSPDILKLVAKIESLAAVSRQGKSMLIKVVAPEQDYWPLPWYFRGFHLVGWWDQLPEDPFAPVMVISAQLHAGLDAKGTHLMVGYFQLRPQVF